MARLRLLLVIAHAALGLAQPTQGAPTYDAYPPRSMEPQTDPQRWSARDVADWVESTGYFEYREAFLEASIDGKRLLKLDADNIGSVLMLRSVDHAYVLDMEIKELRERRGLLSRSELAQHRQRHPLITSLDVSGVGELLADAGLGRHVTAFAAARIDGPRLLRLSGDDISRLTARAVPNAHEQNEAEAEQLVAMVEHLRWQAVGRGDDGSRGSGKEEL